MKIRGLGNRQMYLLPQSIAAFSVSRRLNFTTLGLDRQKTSPRSLFFTSVRVVAFPFVDPYSRFRPIERTDPHPTFRNLGKSNPSWPVCSRCQAEAGRRIENLKNLSRKKEQTILRKKKKRSFDRQFTFKKMFRERM